jgi:rRNA-processing protein EBP2
MVPLDHMAKVKDRLIFETKKMDAVAQRKANKEQKLRSKESQANKLAEKAKKKKEHFQAVEAWAESAQANRGRGLSDRDDGSAFFQSGGDSKKRARADEKFGRGGKRGRFKQNDPKDLNDMSSFNRRGNFGGIGTKKSTSSSKTKTGVGANRKGKRARDASRSR